MCEEEKSCSAAGGGKLNAPAVQNVLRAAALWEDPAHWDDMQPFKWTVPCGGGGGTDVLSGSNSPTAPYAANPTPCRACKEWAVASVAEEKVLIASLYFCSSTFVSFSHVLPLFPHFLPAHSHARLSFCLSHPSFFFLLYIHLFVLGKLTPTSVGGEGGWHKAPRGKAFPHTANFGRGERLSSRKGGDSQRDEAWSITIELWT